jgi:hypothetical protein
MNIEAMLNQIVPQVLDQVRTTLATVSDEQTLYDYETMTHHLLQAIGRLVLQGILDQVGSGLVGPTQSCSGCDGMQHYHDQEHPLSILTSVGALRLARRASYRCPQCHASSYPLDQRLGLPAHGKTSRFLQEQIGWLLADVPVAMVGATLEKFFWPHVPNSQIRLLGEGLGQELEAHDAERVAQIQAETQHLTAPTPIRQVPESARLGAGPDGWMYCTTSRDPQTGAYQWKEAKTLAVFEAVPGPAADEAALPTETRGCWARIAAQLPPPVPPTDVAERISYVVRMGSWQEAGPWCWAELYERGAGTVVQDVAVIADGAEGLSEMVETHLCQSSIRVTRILDIRHAQQHLWAVAHAAFATVQAQHAWIGEPLVALEQGRLHEVVTALTTLAAQQPDVAPLALTTQTYFERRFRQIDYPAFVQHGYPIGSGVAESACKRFGTDRMKGTGMRWTISGAQHVATLRSYRLSHRWQEVVAHCRARAA